MHAASLLLAAGFTSAADLVSRGHEGPTRQFSVSVAGGSYTTPRNLTQIPLNATVNDYVALAGPVEPAFLTGNNLPSNGLFYQYYKGVQYGAFIRLPTIKDDLSQVVGLHGTSSFGWVLDDKTRELTFHYEDTQGDFYLCKETVNGTGYDFLKWGPTKKPIDAPCEGVKLTADFL